MMFKIIYSSTIRPIVVINSLHIRPIKNKLNKTMINKISSFNSAFVNNICNKSYKLTFLPYNILSVFFSFNISIVLFSVVNNNVTRIPVKCCPSPISTINRFGVYAAP